MHLVWGRLHRGFPECSLDWGKGLVSKVVFIRYFLAF